MSIRDKRETAYWPLWLRHQHEPKTMLPLYLDAIDAIDRESTSAGFMAGLAEDMTDAQAPELKIDPPEPRAPTDAELQTWINAHPREFEQWVARQTAQRARRAPARKRTT